MNKKEYLFLTENITKAVIMSIPVMIRKIVREEIELYNSSNNEQILENKKQVIKNRVVRKLDKGSTLKEIYGVDPVEAREDIRPKVRMPSTGNRALDDLIGNGPTEDDLIRESQRPITVPQGKPIPVEELYLNDIKNISSQVAENVDYSAFLESMDRASGDKTMAPAAPFNATSYYQKDPNSIIENQKVLGPANIVKQYKA